MSLYGGNWILSADEYMRPCWVHKLTGERSYNPIDRRPLVQQQMMIQQQQQQQRQQRVPMQPQYGAAIATHYVPQVAYTSPGMTPMFAGTIPPALTVPTTKWTEHFDSRGKKFWVNNITREMTVDDPFI